LAPPDSGVCPSCGYTLPSGSTFCPQCGRDLSVRPASGDVYVPSKKRRNWLASIVGIVVLFGLDLGFQLGYGGLVLAFVVPAVACLLLHEWERSRGLKPGWKFYVLSAAAVVLGTAFGFIWVLIPIVIYFVWLYRKMNRIRSVPTAYRQSPAAGTTQ
jgi:hypothetical protein